ncbi:MAG: hypothetical protein JWO94_3528 [Verrucomicrobiaceae bacterium]|nr:hypothetical protein [Verrucomicrobiaceae bacterium]
MLINAMNDWQLTKALDELDSESLIPASLADTPEAAFIERMGRRQMLKLGALGMLGASGGGAYYYWSQQVPPLYFDGHYAHTSNYHPEVVRRAVTAGNEVVDKPYETGGGHSELFDDGFDCSGSVSHVLYRAGLLGGPLTSGGFADYGLAGAGRFINIYAKPGHHVFMSICGLRFDTSGGPSGQGPRWRPNPRPYADFVMRHPNGW